MSSQVELIQKKLRILRIQTEKQLQFNIVNLKKAEKILLVRNESSLLKQNLQQQRHQWKETQKEQQLRLRISLLTIPNGPQLIQSKAAESQLFRIEKDNYHLIALERNNQVSNFKQQRHDMVRLWEAHQRVLVSQFWNTKTKELKYQNEPTHDEEIAKLYREQSELQCQLKRGQQQKQRIADSEQLGQIAQLKQELIFVQPEVKYKHINQETKIRRVYSQNIIVKHYGPKTIIKCSKKKLPNLQFSQSFQLNDLKSQESGDQLILNDHPKVNSLRYKQFPMNVKQQLNGKDQEYSSDLKCDSEQFSQQSNNNNQQSLQQQLIYESQVDQKQEKLSDQYQEQEYDEIKEQEPELYQEQEQAQEDEIYEQEQDYEKQQEQEQEYENQDYEQDLEQYEQQDLEQYEQQDLEQQEEEQLKQQQENVQEQEQEVKEDEQVQEEQNQEQEGQQEEQKKDGDLAFEQQKEIQEFQASEFQQQEEQEMKFQEDLQQEQFQLEQQQYNDRYNAQELKDDFDQIE